MEREPDMLAELGQLLNRAPCGIGIYDKETGIPVFLNDAYYALVGYTADEHRRIQLSYDALMYAQDLPTSHKSRADFEAHGNASGYEYRIVCKDGSVRWVRLDLTSVEIDEKKYAFASFVDVTAEKEAYRQISMIAENVGSSISMFRICKNAETMLYANERFFTMIGVPRAKYEQDPRMYDLLVVAEEDRRKIAQALRQAMETGWPVDVVHRLHCADGRELWVSRRCAALRQESPDTYLFISVVTDVTQQKEAELASALEQQRYQLVIDELKATVFEWNLGTGGFYASPAFSGYTLSRVDPKTLFSNCEEELYHPQDKSAVDQFFARARAGAHRAETVLRLKRTDGSFRWSRLVGLFYRDTEEKLLRAVGVIIDINEERENNVVLTSLLNELPGGVAVLKVAHPLECQYYTNGLAALSGRTRREMDELLAQGGLLDTFVDAADRGRLLELVQEAAAISKPININFRYRVKQGGITWVHLSATKIREENGSPIYYCIFTRPSDETKLYHDVVEQSPVGVFVAERATRNILYLNDALRRVFGFSPETACTGASLSSLAPRENWLLTDADVQSLSCDAFSEFHVMRHGRYFAVRAKAMLWNSVDSYILYVSDETAEHEHHVALEQLVNRIPGGIGIFELYNGKAHHVYTNDSFYQLFAEDRSRRGADLNEDFFRNVYPEDRAILQAGIDDILAGAEHTHLEYRSRKGNGAYTWLRLTASVVERQAGKATVYCCFMDCDEAVRARRKLEATNAAIRQQYEQELARRNFLEKDSAATICADAETGALLDFRFGDACHESYRRCRSYDEMLTRLLAHIPEENQRSSVRFMLDAENLRRRFRQGKLEEAAEYRSIQEDGTLCWYRAVSNLLQQTSSGRLLAYVYFYNIDKEKKAQLAMQSIVAEETELILLLEVRSNRTYYIRERNALDGVDSSRAFDFSEILASPGYACVQEEDKAAVADFYNREKLLAVLKKMPVATVSYRHIRANGTVQRKRAMAFYLDSTHTDIVFARRDITDVYREEQRQKDALKQIADRANRANRAKTDFLSRMSHDMRTPMNGILGLAALSADEKDAAVLRQNMARIRESGKYLLGLINDTLDFQKIETGKLTLAPQAKHCGEVFQAAVNLIRISAAQKNIDFRLENRGVDMNCVVSVDAVRLQQIIINLASNAIKFSPQDGVVRMELERLDEDAAALSLRFRIIDSGIGMSREFLEKRLYKPFEQESSEVSPQYTGTGIGMAITKSLVEIMGGRIDVDSTLGKGTTFTVTLRLPKVDAETADTMAAQKKLVQGSVGEILHGRRILLCEDHPLNAMIAQKLLEKQGCRVTLAENGRRGLELFEMSDPGCYDAVLMDIRMPVMDGLEAARRLRRLDRPDAAGVPVIAMTANAYDEDIRRSHAAGMNAHLAKPIDPAVLYQTLAEEIVKWNR